MFKKLLLFTAILLSTFTFGQQEVQIGKVTNNIVLGPFAGNRDLAFGVKNILEEVKRVIDTKAGLRVWTEECDENEGKKRQKAI